MYPALLARPSPLTWRISIGIEIDVALEMAERTEASEPKVTVEVRPSLTSSERLAQPAFS